ncbi:hypothetical protein O181_021354 [Austropuccinia psidii MF-1]|uniref:Uncharacterized protein n=1 Tax=Austropuccinia psidii MF-1 TaxID=1389203 RepID=A0A9Q3CCZ7_9BASI|nr:hypothetical protein [Austropuccinia psidii MF-1]
MAYIHCQHSSANDAPCQCPVFEESGYVDGKAHACDTCGHRPEWHLPQVKQPGNLPDPEMEHCKANSLPGQQCSCPLWVSNDDPAQQNHCALCGHKKGWHRPKIVSLKRGPEPILTSQETDPTTSLKRVSRRLVQSPSQTQSLNGDIDLKMRRRSNTSWTLNTKPMFESLKAHHNPTEDSFNHLLFKSATVGPADVPSHAVAQLHVLHANDAQLALRHKRFILEGWDQDAGQSPDNSLTEELTPSNFNKEFSGLQLCTSPLLSACLSDLNPNPSSKFGNEYSPESKKPSGSIRELSDSSNQNMVGSLSLEIKSSSSQNTGPCPSEKMTPKSITTSTSDSLSCYQLGKFGQSSRSFSETTNLVSGEFSLSYPPTNQDSVKDDTNSIIFGNSLVAKITSATVLKELSTDHTPNPSEIGSGIFSPRSMTSTSNNSFIQFPYDQAKYDKILPFQTNNDHQFRDDPLIRGINNSFGASTPISRSSTNLNIANKKFEEFNSENQTLTLLVSPPPSSTIYSPGDTVNIMVRLKDVVMHGSVSSTAEQEYQLAKWKRLVFQLRGFVNKTGVYNDPNQHDILDFTKLIFLARQNPVNPYSAECHFEFKIPTHVTCGCSPGHLPLPSSCSASDGHVMYYFNLKGKRKKAFLATATEDIFIQIRVKSKLLDPRDQLKTLPVSLSSSTSWNAISVGPKATILNALLTYQIEFISLTTSTISYEINLTFSSDSQIDNSIIQQILAKTIVEINNVKRLNSSHNQVLSNWNYQNVKLPPNTFRTSKGTIIFQIPGYLKVMDLTPSSCISSNLLKSDKINNLQSKCLITRYKNSKQNKITPLNSIPWTLKVLIQSNLLSQPLYILGKIGEFQSICSIRAIMKNKNLTSKKSSLYRTSTIN